LDSNVHFAIAETFFSISMIYTYIVQNKNINSKNYGILDNFKILEGKDWKTECSMKFVNIAVIHSQKIHYLNYKINMNTLKNQNTVNRFKNVNKKKNKIKRRHNKKIK